VAVVLGGAVSTAIDMRVRRIPNILTLTIACAGVALAGAHRGGVSVAGAFEGLAVGFLMMLPGHFFGATGAGDVKLFAATGTLLGPLGIFAAFFYTAIAGGLIGCAVALRRRRLRETVARTAALMRTAGANAREIQHPSMNNRFAYAPAIAIGTLVAALQVV